MDELCPVDHAEQVAIFRSQVIGVLICRMLARGELRAELVRLSKQAFRPPRSKRTRTYSVPTLERWFRSSFLSQNPPEVEIIQRHFLETPVEGYIGCSEAIRKLHYLDQLSAIQTSTLIMVGKDDPATPVAASEAMNDAIQDSRMVVISNAAHLSNMEQADAFNRALLDFLLKQ